MKCRICNKEFTNERYCEPYNDICSSECYRINFWKEIEQEKDKHLFIKGQSYSIGPENSTFKGYGGRYFKIRLNTGEIIETSNLWNQGVIPDEFKESLKDNAEFI